MQLVRHYIQFALTMKFCTSLHYVTGFLCLGLILFKVLIIQVEKRNCDNVINQFNQVKLIIE